MESNRINKNDSSMIHTPTVFSLQSSFPNVVCIKHQEFFHLSIIYLENKYWILLVCQAGTEYIWDEHIHCLPSWNFHIKHPEYSASFLFERKYFTYFQEESIVLIIPQKNGHKSDFQPNQMSWSQHVFLTF